MTEHEAVAYIRRTYDATCKVATRLGLASEASIAAGIVLRLAEECLQRRRTALFLAKLAEQRKKNLTDRIERISSGIGGG